MGEGVKESESESERARFSAFVPLPCSSVMSCHGQIPHSGNFNAHVVAYPGVDCILDLGLISTISRVFLSAVLLLLHTRRAVLHGLVRAYVHCNADLCFQSDVTTDSPLQACKDLGVRGVGFWTADMPDYTTDQGTMMWAAVAKGFAATPSSASPLQGGGM